MQTNTRVLSVYANVLVRKKVNCRYNRSLRSPSKTLWKYNNKMKIG